MQLTAWLVLSSFFAFSTNALPVLDVAKFNAVAKTKPSFDEATAKYFVEFAGAAYCAGRSVDKWDCAACKKHPGVTATSFHGKSPNVNGFVSYDPAKHQVMVSFAGTDPLSIRNWIADLDTVRTAYPGCSGCEVHKGFYESYLSVRDAVRALVAAALAAHPGAALALTGHSLGAALAAIAALDLTEQGHEVQQVYDFGKPRWANDALMSYYWGVPVFRLTHARDPVPHLPLQSMGFRHAHTEVFYDGDTGQVCDGSGEDPACSNRYWLDVNVLDHLFYLGFDFATNYIGCKL